MTERRSPTSTQLAMRVAIFGGVAFLLFAIVFFRLWFLQILSGEKYVADARENRVRKVRIEAPRGDVVDRNGTVLVSTRIAPVVQLVPSSLPHAELKLADQYRVAVGKAESERQKAGERLEAMKENLRTKRRKHTRWQLDKRKKLERAAQRARPVTVPPLPRREKEMVALFHRLGRIVGMSGQRIHQRVIERVADQPYANVVIKTDVPRSAFNYLRERQDKFPGIVAEKQYLRRYPHKTLGAQLFGTIRQISPEELEQRKYRDIPQGTRIGKDGIEETYDDWLRGRDGNTKVVVNAHGERDERRKATRNEPKQGHQLKLTLDLELQREANDALRQAAQSATGMTGPVAGAYVAMDPRNGEVVALGSYPSFDANVFAKPISQHKFAQLNSAEHGAPLFNRAIAATYPPASTFKPITALAAVDSGVLSPSEVIGDSGTFKLGNQTYKNARGAAYGSLTLATALKVSSDVFFYNLGVRADAKGAVIQKWARRLSLGGHTGIDLPGEFDGLVPDRRWRDAGYRKYLKCINRNHLQIHSFDALTNCGGLDRPWTAGDNVNFAVGQGDLQATPLQMAVAYSTIVNGGKVIRPHLGKAVEDGIGRMVQEIHIPPKRRVQIDQGARGAIMEGLRTGAMEPGGTSYRAFGGFAGGKLNVYGKTGTAEHTGQSDQSWYTGYIEHPERPLVIVVTIEKGGFGATTAAPVARKIADKWFAKEVKADDEDDDKDEDR